MLPRCARDDSGFSPLQGRDDGQQLAADDQGLDDPTEDPHRIRAGAGAHRGCSAGRRSGRSTGSTPPATTRGPPSRSSRTPGPTILVFWWSPSASACSLALGLARLIADPLTSLGVLAEQVSKGDLTTDIRSQSRDEIGWLEHSMRQMVKNLREIATQIAVSSRTVAQSAEEISASLDPDGQGRGDAVQLDRGDLVHHGRDRLPDAAPGPERRGAGRERGPDLGLDPGDERDADPDGARTARCSSARSRRPPARSAP